MDAAAPTKPQLTRLGTNQNMTSIVFLILFPIGGLPKA